MKPGTIVQGELFETGVVLATGTVRELHRYDRSGATEELEPSTPCVAVRLPDGLTAVYVAEEVWES